MRGINKVILVGHLGKDPEVQYLEGGVALARFSLATSESYKDRDGNRVDQTEWHNIVFWRKQAEIAEKYLRKGSLIYMEGKLKTRSWDDKEGNKRYTTEVVGDTFVMLDKKDDTQSSSASREPQSVSTNNNVNEEEQGYGDDLPF